MMPSPEDSTTNTNAHLLTMDDYKIMMARIDERLKNLLDEFGRMRERLESHNSPSRAEFQALQDDVRNLQNFRWWILGIGAAFSFLSHVLLKAIGL